MTFSERFWSKVNKTSTCWEWNAQKDACGYGRFKVGDKPRAAHRISYELNCGPIPEGMHVLHACDNPGCVFPGHLSLGTPAENAADKVAKDRQPRLYGEKNGRAKLSSVDVIAIRGAEGVTQRKLAAQYGVALSLISQIRTHKRWSNLP